MKIVWVLLLLFDSMLIDDELRAEGAIEAVPDLPCVAQHLLCGMDTWR